jgi:hypothetical protein
MVENGRATRRNFFFFRSSKNTIVEKEKQFTKAEVRPSPRPRHAVNFRHRVSVCTALHFLLQNRMPHRAQL